MSYLEKVEKSQNNEDLRINPNIPMQDRDSILKLWGVINSGKPYAQILEYIDNEIQESVRTVSFNYQISCFLSDGAYALSRAVEGKIGFAKQQNSGPSGEPPKMIDVKFADGNHIKVPFGKINLPIFGDDAYVDMKYDSSNQILHVNGQCQKRYVRDLDNIIDETINIIKTDSIYKNQALRFEKGKEPTFIDLKGMDNIPLFLTPEAKFATEPIEARIERTEECIKNNIDIKFGAILEGPYGSGKTLYASKLALKAVRNNWTYVYCKNPEDAKEALQMAQKFSANGKGILLFVEDIDRVLNSRNDMTNEISLLMDGGETKTNNVITLFTTNHIENIDPTFLRGKRVGSIVTLAHLDKETAKEMLLTNLKDEFGDSLVEGEINEAAAEIEKLKIVPAFISEITDRVKTHLIFSERTTVTNQDILSAIKNFQRQMDIAKAKSPEPSLYEKTGMILSEIIQKSTASIDNSAISDNEVIQEIAEKVDVIYQNT